MFELRDITRDDLPAISALGIRSKASWGYPEEMMRVFREELTINEAEFDSLLVAKLAERDGATAGYFSLKAKPGNGIELEHLFVEPEQFEKGVGTRLLAEAVSCAVKLGHRELTLIADPFAESFYTKHGAEVIGQHASTDIPGRFIPIMRMALS